jgi:5'-3' exonuclease
MSLNDILDIVPSDKPENRDILMLDFYNMVFRYVSIAHKNNPLDEQFLDWKYMMTYGLLKMVKQFKPEQFIIAVDEGSSWRKQIYPEYKGKRKANRDGSGIDFDKFFPILSEFISSLKSILPNVYILSSEGIEADDFIGVLVKKLEGNNIINISTDKDFYQLYKYKGYRQYHPMTKKFIKVLNPYLDLHTKLLIGDTSDNIPQVRKKMGPKTAEKYYKKLDELFVLDGDKVWDGSEEMEPGEIEKKYILNKQLIDLELIPLEIQNTIHKLYDNYDFKPYNGRKVYNDLTEHKLTKVLGYIQDFNAAFKPLKSYKELLV